MDNWLVDLTKEKNPKLISIFKEWFFAKTNAYENTHRYYGIRDGLCISRYCITVGFKIIDLEEWFENTYKQEVMNTEFKIAQQKVDNLSKNKGEISDGYHTFNELYEFRKVYNAALFNEWAKKAKIIGWKNPFIHENPIYEAKYDVHKSWKHHDGELCFGGGWFIVVAVLPTGQISNHYEAKDWDLFEVPETETAKYPFDGHTSADVLERLKTLH